MNAGIARVIPASLEVSMRVASLLLLLSCAVAAPALAQDAASVDRVTLTGRVLDSATNLPVEAVAVKVDGMRIPAVTDSLGRFALASVSAGTHRVTVSRIGYHDTVHELDVGAGMTAVLHIAPQPMVLEQITATVDAFESRRRSVAYASRVGTQRDLAHATSPTLTDYLAKEFNFRPVQCPNVRADLCLRVRGRTRTLRLYVDDNLITGSWGYLNDYPPQQLYRVEVYPALAMLRIYTPWYVEKMAKAQMPPRTITGW
jgi:hypothetical protein